MLRSIVLFVVLLVFLPSCGVPEHNATQRTAPLSQSVTPTPPLNAAFLQDANLMATEMGIPVDDVLRRVQLQEQIAPLHAALEQREAPTFAGLWVQHQPEFRVVVAFTQNGPETLHPYVVNTPLQDVIEVRSATATYSELKEAQQKTQHLLQKAGLSVTSAINLQANQVELSVTDRTLFDTTLQKANLQLPDHVAVVTVYEPLHSPLPFPITPEPTITFPQLKIRSTIFMTALAVGELFIQEGCLRLGQRGSRDSLLVLWQPDYFLNNRNGMIEILDREGAVVARVGDEIRMGGGEVPPTAGLEQQLREPIPTPCHGPYWVMGEFVTQN